MAKISKQVTDKQRSSKAVVAAAGNHAAVVQEKLAALLGAEAGAAAAVLMRACGGYLGAQTEAMVRADDAHASELSDDAHHRDARDAATAELSDAVVRLKEQLGAVAGRDYLQRIKADGVTPSDPAALERAATNILQGMADTPAPTSLLPGYTVDPERFAAPLRAPLEKLRAALNVVKDEEEQAETSLSTRNVAVSGNDQAFSRVANLLSAILVLAGQTDQAKKVRPSRRKPGLTAEDAGDADDVV